MHAGPLAPFGWYRQDGRRRSFFRRRGGGESPRRGEFGYENPNSKAVFVNTQYSRDLNTATMERNVIGRGSVGGTNYDSDDGEVFLDEDDVIDEISIDEEELPDRDDDDMDSDVDCEKADDSLYIFTGHADELFTVACSPIDASLVVTGGIDHMGYLWKVGSEDFSVKLQGHVDTVSTVAFSSDGQFLASGSLDGLIQVWDANLGSIKCKLEGSGGSVEWLKWHPKEHLILSGCDDCSVWLWNAGKSVCLNSSFYLKTFYGHGDSVTCGDFTPDGKTICTGSDDASLRIWNLETGESIKTVKGHSYHTKGLTCLSITHNSAFAITGSEDSSVHMVNLKTGKVVNSLVSHSKSVECIGLSPSFHWAATGSLDKKLIIWDLQHSSPRCTCEHEDGIICLLWLGVSRYVATGSEDGKVRIWDTLTGSCVCTFEGHEEVVQSLAISADQNSLVSVSSDGTARVFDVSKFR